MKRKIFIGLFPVLLALSACGGSRPIQNPEVETFLEDTLLHEELFDQKYFSSSKKVSRNLVDVDSDEPIVGVQVSNEYTIEEAKYVAVRFVAAIKVTSPNFAAASATWTRSMFEKSGTLHGQENGTKVCTKAYTTITDGDSTLSIGDFNTAHGGTTYTHFVTYSVRNIPENKYGCTINASLSFNDGTKTVTTNIVSTTGNLPAKAIHSSFTSDELSNHAGKYFLKGVFDGTPNIIDQDNNTPAGNLAYFDPTLKQGDTFVLAWNNLSSHQFRLFDRSSLQDSNEVGLQSYKNVGGKFVVQPSSRDYVIYVNNQSNLWVNITGDMNYIDLYIGPTGGDLALTEYTNIATGTDWLSCKINIAASKDVAFKIGNEAIDFYDGETKKGSIYTTAETGYYVFYINVNYRTYVTAPQYYTISIVNNSTIMSSLTYLHIYSSNSDSQYDITTYTFGDNLVIDLNDYNRIIICRMNPTEGEETGSGWVINNHKVWNESFAIQLDSMKTSNQTTIKIKGYGSGEYAGTIDFDAE